MTPRRSVSTSLKSCQRSVRLKRDNKNASVVIERIETDIIGNERPLFVFICLFDILIAVDIKVLFAPFDYLIFGKILFPRCHAVFNEIGIFGSSEPAKMYHLRYFRHCFLTFRKIQQVSLRIYLCPSRSL